jgi:hypothetical protein
MHAEPVSYLTMFAQNIRSQASLSWLGRASF